jgi:hypothetical protein
MKKIWGLGGIVMSAGLGFTQMACSGGAQGSAEPASVNPTMDDLIGSVPVNSASLDGIGAIGFSYDYGRRKHRSRVHR